jgi:hypothetical protein
MRVNAADPSSGLTHYLYAELYNGGGRAAKDLRIELAHSVTRCFSLRHDERQWHDEGQGQLNPRVLRAYRPLVPKESRLIAVIPISMQTPLPVSLRLRFSTKETAMLEQHLCLDGTMLDQGSQFDFVAGAGPELAPTPAPGISAAAA